MRIGREAAPRAGLLAGRVGVTGLLKKEDPVLSAEVGVICPEPWGVTESWSGGNRGFNGAERVKQVGRGGAGVFLLRFERLAPESGETSVRLSTDVEMCDPRGTSRVALVMGVSRSEVAPSLSEFSGDKFGVGAGGGRVALGGGELSREQVSSGLSVPRVSGSPAEMVAGIGGIAVARDGHVMESEAPTFNESVFFEKLGREWVRGG